MKFRNIAAITIGTIAMATTTFCASNINVTLNGLNITLEMLSLNYKWQNYGSCKRFI